MVYALVSSLTNLVQLSLNKTPDDRDVFLGTRMTRDQAPRRQHTDTRDPKVQKVDQSLQSNGHGHNPKMVNGYANGHAKIE